MMKRERIAKIVRAASVPPVWVALLLILVYALRPGVFAGLGQMIAVLVCLAGVPLAAYPIAALIPSLRRKGREGQRNLAFVMNLAGYVLAWGYALISGASQGLRLIVWTYLISVAVLTVLNKVVGLRASGHACSIVGPMLLAVRLLGWGWAPPCAALLAAVVWSSLALKRHTPGELALGAASALVSFAASVLIT